MTNEFELNQPHIVSARSIDQLLVDVFFLSLWCLVVSALNSRGCFI